MNEILNLSDTDLLLVLQKVENLTLIAALAGTDPNVIERVCSVLSDRACSLLLDDMATPRVTNLSRDDVRAAQDAVSEVVRQVMRGRQ